MNIEDLKNQIKKHSESVDKLRTEISVFNRKILELRLEYAFKRWGVREGSIVEVGDDKFKVIEVDFWFDSIDDKPWLKGVKMKKDGSWSKRANRIHSAKWELVE